HQHFLLDLRIVRGHVANPAFFEVAADHAFMRPGDDLDQHAFATTTAVDARDAGQATVAEDESVTFGDYELSLAT
ncbi:MAG TPA: hypothetical protein DGQ94_19935, partial [Pseudomonas sp.]|nr:hypothetical protein [Pseudomonas sp.]